MAKIPPLCHDTAYSLLRKRCTPYLSRSVFRKICLSSASSSDNSDDARRQRSSHAHWRENLRLMVVLLSFWFVVSYLLGIVFVEPLNQFHLGGFPAGFWFAQQGSIYFFILLTLVYAFAMDRIDRRHGVESGSAPNQSKDSSEMSE